MVIIHSHHSNSERRQQIRETWAESIKSGVFLGTKLKHRLAYAFTFGVNRDEAMNDRLVQESVENGDVIQGNFTEDYTNMTYKNVMGLQWTLQYCNAVRYLIKSDDDVMLNLPQLLDFLSNHTKENNNGTYFTRSVIGAFVDDNICIRNHFQPPYNIKWALPPSVYPFKHFPNFLYGAAYVVTSDIIAELYHTSKYIPYIFIDDMWVTGILRTVINANIVGHFRNTSHHQGFVATYPIAPQPCLLVNEYIYSLSLQKYYDFFIKLKNKNIVCKTRPQGSNTMITSRIL